MTEEEIFNEALARGAADRGGYLDAACAGDPALRAGVEALLRANVGATGFLAGPAPAATIDQPTREGPGTVIGPYKLLEQIGEGGFGVVFMAEQTHPVRRKVALKVLKPGMDTRQVVARFEAERQALAIMDHPNIAKVFDGGATPSGRPYFVMELVKGVPITEFCDQNHLTPRQRLELFIPVCQAVQHAHQKGLIHRDLKPFNVLVSRHDTTPIVKVIDFGVAKALGQELTDKTLFTGIAQMVGTPLYMSPEQAGMSDLDVDTRSDIYSLGVLLYELLTGTTPFTAERFRTAAYDEIRRIIREEEPPKPSTRLSESKDALPSISAQRKTEPARLSRVVRGELDWIVMKALEKDRNRRYETANGFAADVQRYLADEPVQACPPSMGYRLRKFARRNKPGLAVAMLVLFFLVLLGSGVGWAVRDRAAREEEVAREREARRTKVAGQVESILAEVDRLTCEQKWSEALAAARRAEAVAAGGDADAATAQRVRAWQKDLEFIDRLEQARMRLAVWVDGTFDYSGAIRQYAQTFRDYGVDVEALPVETSIDLLNARPALAIPLAAALDDWVGARQQASKTDAAGWMRLLAVARGIDREPLRDRLRATWGQPVAQMQDEVRRLAASIDIRSQHPATLHCLALTLRRDTDRSPYLRFLREAQFVYPGDFGLTFELGWGLREQKEYEGAIRFLTAALSIRPDSVVALHNLGSALSNQKKLDEAIICYRKAIEIDPKDFFSHNSLGYALKQQGKLDQAIAEFREANRLKPDFAIARHNLALVFAETASWDEAIPEWRKLIELKPDHYWAHCNLANSFRNKGQLDEAITWYRKAILLDPTIAQAHVELGMTFAAKQAWDEALAEYHEAIRLDPKRAATYTDLGIALRGKGQLKEALAAYRTSIRLMAPDDANLRRDNIWGLNNLAWDFANAADLKLRDPGRAVELAKEAVELRPKDANFRGTLGAALYRAGDWKGSIVELEKTHGLRKPDDPSNAYEGFFLAMAHWQLAEKDKARDWFAKAAQSMEKHQPKNEELRRFRAEAEKLMGVEKKKD